MPPRLAQDEEELTATMIRFVEEPEDRTKQARKVDHHHRHHTKKITSTWKSTLPLVVMVLNNISYDNTIMQTAGSSSSAAAAASPLPSADAGEEEHTGQVDMKVMIVVCR